MDKPTAKQILKLYRPGTADAHDPQFADALALVQQDPELAGWFEQHCATYEAIRAKFRQIPVPAGLKEQILSERPVPVITSVAVWWRRPAMVAVAASVALLIGLASAWWLLQTTEADSFSAYRRLMVRTALRTYTMDLETNDLTQIRAHLARANALADYVLPPALEKVEGTGCVALTWHGQRVSMLCFRSGRPLSPGEKSDLYFFVIDRASVARAPTAAPPRFAKVNKLMTASWSQGGKVYVLAGNGDEAFIRQFR